MIKSIILLLLTSCSFMNLKEGPSDYFQSTKITAKIRSELIKRNGLKGLDIQVETINNKVFLNGTVPYLQQKILAEIISKETEGVTAIQNNILVQ